MHAGTLGRRTWRLDERREPYAEEKVEHAEWLVANNSVVVAAVAAVVAVTAVLVVAVVAVENDEYFVSCCAPVAMALAMMEGRYFEPE